MKVKEFRLHTFTILLVLPLLLNTACDKEEEFLFDIDDLVGVNWGIPQILDSGLEPFPLDAPTVFHSGGFVTFAGGRTDSWFISGSRSIILEQTGQRWFIIDLRPDRLYVDITQHPRGTFLIKAIFEPL